MGGNDHVEEIYPDWKCVYDRGPSLCHTLHMHSTVSTTPSNINCLLINGTQWLFKKGLYRSQNCLKSVTRGSWGWLSVLSLYIYYPGWASHLSGDLFMWEMPRYIIFWDATMMCQKRCLLWWTHCCLNHLIIYQSLRTIIVSEMDLGLEWQRPWKWKRALTTGRT